MKQVTLKVSNCSVGQWSTLLLELNVIAKNWRRFGPDIQLQAASIERILAQGQEINKRATNKRHNLRV